MIAAMSLRLPLVVLCCVLLLAVRVLGLHTHFDATHGGVILPTHAMHLATETLPSHVADDAVAEHGGDHVAEHLAHGEVDAETADKSAGKLPSLPLLGLLAVFVIALLAPTRRPAYFVSHAAPSRRRPTHFLPLSHAPPALA